MQNSPNTSTPPNPRELHEALRTVGPNRLQIVSSLLDRGADINGLHEHRSGRLKGGGMLKPRHKVSPLYDAAQRGDVEAVEFLINKGADVNTRNRTGASIASAPFPEARASDTLSALDGMRTSENPIIVKLAENLFGAETEEDVKKRKEAYDGIDMWPPSTKARGVHSGEGLEKRVARQGDGVEEEDVEKGGEEI